MKAPNLFIMIELMMVVGRIFIMIELICWDDYYEEQWSISGF
jgi:hypothetical protein